MLHLTLPLSLSLYFFSLFLSLLQLIVPLDINEATLGIWHFPGVLFAALQQMEWRQVAAV